MYASCVPSLCPQLPHSTSNVFSFAISAETVKYSMVSFASARKVVLLLASTSNNNNDVYSLAAIADE